MSRPVHILTNPDPRTAEELVLGGDPADPRRSALASIYPIERALAATASLITPRLVVRTVLSSSTPDRPAWLPGGASEFAEYARELGSALGLPPLALLPSHDGAISDIPSTLTFLRAHPAWGLVLEPAALLTPAMETRADDHLERLADSLGVHPALVGCILPPDGSSLVEGVTRWILPRLSRRVWLARPRPPVAF